MVTNKLVVIRSYHNDIFLSYTLTQMHEHTPTYAIIRLFNKPIMICKCVCVFVLRLLTSLNVFYTIRKWLTHPHCVAFILLLLKTKHTDRKRRKNNKFYRLCVNCFLLLLLLLPQRNPHR